MISIEPVIIVEGRYDKNKIKQIFDTVVLETAGFGIFKDKEKAALIRRLARTRGILVLTDPDHAGFLIRGYLKNIAAEGKVYHAYIPDRLGKEKRKAHPSREGKLGVEGVTEEEIIQAVRRSGVAMDGRQEAREETPVTKADLYALGLSGGPDSKEKRRLLLKKLDLPENMTAGALLEMINILGGAPLLKQVMEEI
ncbi:DUF4093 domain-containing protein [Intestinimonas butyriciproducens]|uniref:DUF4093 domain-containing protein n=1 Tax=Intestinimonas butyriciproducens TaxID=1297617 RepID=UPI0019580708|nr:DUF4093 domain-containing protein [Intestinimonas butyriciproducens]